MTSRTVLVIDDNPASLKMARTALSAEGYRILEARDGAAAIDLMRREAPDLILQDLVLPDMNGYDLIRTLRSLPNGAAIPILAFSGFLSRPEYERTTAAGFTDFLPKPLAPSRLVEAVHQHLQEWVPSPEQAGRGRRLLLVDDDPIQAKMIRLRLSHLGFTVAVAGGGREALNLAAQDPPDAIVSDVLMPGLDGFGLAVELRRSPRLARTPLILVSSNYVEKTDVALARKAGANALVVRTPELREAIDALFDVLDGRLPAPTPAAPGEILGEYHSRLVRQLERQLSLNVANAYRSSMHTAMLSVVAGISESLAQERDLESSLPDLLASLLDAAGVSQGAIHLKGAEPDGGPWVHAGLSIRAAAGLPSFFGAGSVLRQVEKARHPLVLPSAAVSPDAAAAVLSGLGAESALVVPVLTGVDCLGVLVLASKSPNLTEPDWIPFGKTMAIQVGQALAVGRAFARLAASERGHRALLRSAGDAIEVLDARGLIREVNHKAESMIGLSRDALVGRSWLDFILPEERPAAARQFQELVATGRLKSARFHFGASGRKPVPVELSGSVVDPGSDGVLLLIARDITERLEGEKALRASELRLMRLFETVNLIVLGLDRNARVDYVNPYFLKLTGYAREEVLGAAWFGTFLPERNRPEMSRVFAELLDRESHPHYENPILTKAGVERMIAWHNTVLRDDAGWPSGTLSVGEDVTEHRRLEEQYRQAQKMEAVGRLAGGIAHDFNNLLTAILGFSELTMSRLSEDDPVRLELQEVLKAGHRAAGLTRQMLVFSRRQVVQRRLTDLNERVTDVGRMLRRLIGEDVELETRLGPGLNPVLADAGQIEQVLMNLAVNARDAMPGGGRLTIETADGMRREGSTAEWVMLAVSDTGTGMTPEVKSHLFEPFFTTKEVGKGTGLGLATVYGIVEQSGGSITVDSEPGRGTTVRIFFPKADASQESKSMLAASGRKGGHETILLVEDEDSVRKLAGSVLRMNGYTVVEATQGGEGLKLVASHPGPIAAAIVDVIMPVMSGHEFSRRLGEVRPEIRVLFMSGYSDTVVHDLVATAGIPFLQKPFSSDQLLNKIRDVLDTKPT